MAGCCIELSERDGLGFSQSIEGKHRNLSNEKYYVVD